MPALPGGVAATDGAAAVLDLRGQGAAMRIGALPSLATGDYPRPRTQVWARAIYEDQPVARQRIHGVYYDAAHSNGHALALWNTDFRIEVVRSARGEVQDFALADPRCGRASSMPRTAWVCARIWCPAVTSADSTEHRGPVVRASGRGTG
ncbi:RES domain-containing protein [Rhodococcus oxybenzonivorans]|nr:RES domain-containing protein [Rhodococcus oxybenzonivorans]MDV7352006.1 RES domain-containing protein [Rhodococcus oxybenzonivorans]